MTETEVFQLFQPGSFIDPQALLAQAVEAEVATLLGRYADESADDGRQRLVRHGAVTLKAAIRVTEPMLNTETLWAHTG